MSTPTSSTGINATAQHDAALDNKHIGSPADSRRLNSTGSQGSGINSGIAVTQNSEVRPITVKDVDSTVITGSHKSGNDNVSAKFSTDAFKNQAGPRGDTNDSELEGA
jgi:hypothetical protein